MLKAKFRLRKQRNFENVFKRGSFFYEKILFLKVVKNNMPFSRFGFIVGNKVSKKAVERNRIKRIMRESIRLKQDKIKAGFDFVFISKPEILHKKFSEIELVLERLIKKARLFI